MDAIKLIKDSHYGIVNGFLDHWQAKEDKRRADFIRRGDVISHNILNRYSKVDSGIDRVLRLKDIRFSKPFSGLIPMRLSIHGVISVHYIAGYKIIIKRFEDSSEDTIWYETPIYSYHCKIPELEEIIHEHILEAIQRDLEWNRLK